MSQSTGDDGGYITNAKSESGGTDAPFAPPTVRRTVRKPKDPNHHESAAEEYEYQSRNALASEDVMGGRFAGQRTVYPDAARSVARLDDAGDLVDRRGNKVDTASAERKNRTEGSSAEGRYIVAMTGDGTLHVADEASGAMPEARRLAIEKAGGQKQWVRIHRKDRLELVLEALKSLRFHHSSLVAGGSVAAAGEIGVADGEIHTVSDKSGHYRPDFAMTAQMHARLAPDLEEHAHSVSARSSTLPADFTKQEGDPDKPARQEPTRAASVTWELGNYAGHKHLSDTRLSGTEMDAYLGDDVQMDKLMKEAARAAAEASGLKPGSDEFVAFRDAELAEFRTLSERDQYARARELIEIRHGRQRSVQDDLAGVWLRDPLNGSRQRERVEGRWTARIRADSTSEPRTDPHFHRITHKHNGWKHDLLAQNGWRYWRDGAWTERVHDNPSHNPTSEYPEYADADGQRVLNEVLGNHRLDPPTQEA